MLPTGQRLALVQATEDYVHQFTSHNWWLCGSDAPETLTSSPKRRIPRLKNKKINQITELLRPKNFCIQNTKFHPCWNQAPPICHDLDFSWTRTSQHSMKVVHCVKLQGLLQDVYLHGLAEEKLGDFFHAFGCNVTEVFVQTHADRKICNGSAHVVFADTKSVDLAVKLHNSTGSIQSSRPWRRGPHGNLSVDGIVSIERVNSQDQHNIMNEIVATSQLLDALRRQEQARIAEASTGLPDTKCIEKQGTSEEAEELTDVGSSYGGDSIDSSGDCDVEACVHARIAPVSGKQQMPANSAEQTLLDAFPKKVTKKKRTKTVAKPKMPQEHSSSPTEQQQVVDSHKACSIAEKPKVVVVPTVITLRGKIRTPERPKFGAINRGFIQINRNDLEKLRAAHAEWNLQWNPDRADVFFHKKDCCFQLWYGDLVKFTLTLHESGNMLQAQALVKYSQ